MWNWNLIRIQIWPGQGLPTYQSTTVPADGGKLSSRVSHDLVLTLPSCRFLRDRTFSSLSAGRRTGSACITSLGWRARYSSEKLHISVWMSTSQFHHRTENAIERRAGWINVGDLSSAVHFKIVKYERIKFLVIGETIFNLLPTPAYNILHSLFPLQLWGTPLRFTPGLRSLTTSSWHLKVSQVCSRAWYYRAHAW